MLREEKEFLRYSGQAGHYRKEEPPVGITSPALGSAVPTGAGRRRTGRGEAGQGIRGGRVCFQGLWVRLTFRCYVRLRTGLRGREQGFCALLTHQVPQHLVDGLEEGSCMQGTRSIIQAVLAQGLKGEHDKALGYQAMEGMNPRTDHCCSVWGEPGQLLKGADT